MNRILKILLIFFLISNCSFNSNSKFWTKEANIENEKKVLNKNALFKKKKVVQKEFNSNLKIELKFDGILGNNLYNVNNEGIVGGVSAYPFTFAPNETNHKESQLPLNPVCPVKNTRFPCQNL